jgi:hypothetical protein
MANQAGESYIDRALLDGGMDRWECVLQQLGWRFIGRSSGGGDGPPRSDEEIWEERRRQMRSALEMALRVRGEPYGYQRYHLALVGLIPRNMRY